MMNLNFLRLRLDKWIWWGIISFVTVLIFSIAIVQLIVGLLAFLWIAKIALTPDYKFVRTPLDYPFIAFVIVRIFSVLFSVDYTASVLTLYKEIPFYIIYFIITNNLSIDNIDQIKKIIGIMIVAACVASIYGSAKVILGFEERASSSTSGYSTLGMFLAVVISFTLWLGKNKELFPSRWLWSLSLLIMGGGLLLTLNRTHWGVVGIILLVIGLLRERIALLVTLGFSGLAIGFIPSISNRFYQMIHFMEYTSGRNVIWQGALMKFTERPIFGFGPRTFEQIFPLRNQLEDKLIASWHNDFLQVYMESGLFALFAFLWIIAAIYYYGFKIVRLKEIDLFYKEITVAILLGMSAFFLTGFVGGFIIDPITSLLFRFLLGILALTSIKTIKKVKAD
ncbi:MAG: hypothetical protein C0417_00755 [Chlorobiaceae bacterium]|nr:hypothetical protein [Chlorobiaceae bacterium]